MCVFELLLEVGAVDYAADSLLNKISANCFVVMIAHFV